MLMKRLWREVKDVSDIGFSCALGVGGGVVGDLERGWGSRVMVREERGGGGRGGRCRPVKATRIDGRRCAEGKREKASVPRVKTMSPRNSGWELNSPRRAAGVMGNACAHLGGSGSG